MNDKAYNNWELKSDKDLIVQMGQFVQSHRLNQNKTQDEVSKAAGVSRSTLSLLERGEKVRVDSLIQVLRVLNLLHVMEVFKVQEEISPLEYVKLKKKQRKQASPKKSDEQNKEDLGW